MAATFTASGYTASPRSQPSGALTTQTFNFTYGGRSASVSDVIYIGRLANGVKVLDVMVSGKPGSDAACTWKLGTPANDVLFGPAFSISTSIVKYLSVASGFPKTISLSADAEGLLYQPVILTKSTGTSTATGSIQVTFLLQLP